MTLSQQCTLCRHLLEKIIIRKGDNLDESDCINGKTYQKSRVQTRKCRMRRAFTMWRLSILL